MKRVGHWATETVVGIAAQVMVVFAIVVVLAFVRGAAVADDSGSQVVPKAPAVDTTVVADRDELVNLG